MARLFLPSSIELSEGDVEFVSIAAMWRESWDDAACGWLDAGEVVESVTVEELVTTDLTIDNEGPNEDSYYEDGSGAFVDAGWAARFRVQGMEAGTTYNLLVTIVTDGGRTTNGQFSIVTAD